MHAHRGNLIKFADFIWYNYILDRTDIETINEKVFSLSIIPVD